MAESKIARDKFAEFVAALCADYAVYGPKANDSVVVFGKISSAEDLVLDYYNSAISAKDLFLPRTETVYEFDGEDFVDQTVPDRKRVILAMRPCDCRALTLLDQTFDTERLKDPFYVPRRDNTVLIGLACNNPLESCFCTAVGGDPYGEEGADILLDEVGQTLLAKALTEKGKDFLKGYAKFFSDKGSGKWAEQAKAARDKIKSNLQISEDTKPRLDSLFEDDIWEKVSRKCLGCGTCSYLCPTCYCFDLIDEKTGRGVRKIRRWDCCMFPQFTLHASGHNPRSVNAARLRQKVMHKFSYHPERCGMNSCVGCGRCVRRCPVNLDIRQALKELMAAGADTAKK
jgi:ferredoxin